VGLAGVERPPDEYAAEGSLGLRMVKMLSRAIMLGGSGQPMTPSQTLEQMASWCGLQELCAGNPLFAPEARACDQVIAGYRHFFHLWTDDKAEAQPAGEGSAEQP
jgi:hypothetical protein